MPKLTAQGWFGTAGGGLRLAGGLNQESSVDSSSNVLLILLCGCDKKPPASPTAPRKTQNRTDNGGVSGGSFSFPRTVHQLHSPACCTVEFPSVSCNTWNKGQVTSENLFFFFFFKGFLSLSVLEARNRSNQPTAGVHFQLN